MNLRAGFLIVLLAAVFTFGLIRIFSIQFATGSVYPDYSSMNAGPTGAKLLYDGLARTPGVTAARNYFPLDYLEGSNAAIVFLAFNLGELADGPEPYERLARRGARVVIALVWESKEKPAKAVDLEKRWHLQLAVDSGKKPARRLWFHDSPEWRALASEGPKTLAMERDFDKGSVVLVAGSRDFSNDATVKFDRLPLVAAVIGPANRVIFDEQHFGIAESGTVIGLARRFRLTGMALGLALCAALYLWKNSASFPPPEPQPRAASLSGRTSISGLVTLLRRHIRPPDLAATCWNQWLAANRNDVLPARRERAEAILHEHGSRPLDAVREIQTALQSKGPL